MISIYQIKRNYKLLLTFVALLILVWAVTNPTVSGQYVADFITWGLQGIVQLLTKVV